MVQSKVSVRYDLTV